MIRRIITTVVAVVAVVAAVIYLKITPEAVDTFGIFD
jgi:hypothetical protein